MRSEMIDPADLGPEEFYQVKSVLEQSGFEHYEISNYAKPGYRCIHNENYWKLDNYFGLGPAAVGTYGCLRTHNVPDLDRWLGNETPALEQLSQIDKRNEFVMLGLRMLIDGLSISRLERKFGFQTEKFYAELLWQQEQKNLEIQNNRVKFTSKGIAIADSVITSLFI
jgi:oxygen-independent coproporphyrinogen-3 oxidase